MISIKIARMSLIIVNFWSDGIFRVQVLCHFYILTLSTSLSTYASESLACQLHIVLSAGRCVGCMSWMSFPLISSQLSKSVRQRHRYGVEALANSIGVSRHVDDLHR